MGINHLIDVISNLIVFAFIGILIWLYLNSLVLLIGFELNASIKNARIEFDRINDDDI